MEIFSDCINIFQRLLVFSSSRDQIFCCLIGIEVCHSVWGVLRPWNIIYSLIYNYFRGGSDIAVAFSDSGNFFQSHLIFPSSRDKTVAVWIISRYTILWVAGWGDLGPWKTRMKVPFPHIGVVILIFGTFFKFF